MDVQVALFCSWDDFILGHGLDFKDISKWNNQVVSNFLNYQTNYLVVVAIVISIVGFLNPLSMVLGAAVVILVFLAFVWASNNKDFIHKFKKHYPFAFDITIIMLSYFLIFFLGRRHGLHVRNHISLVLDVYSCFLETSEHKEQTGEKEEVIGLKKTPMGTILDILEQQEEGFTKLADYLAKAKK